MDSSRGLAASIAVLALVVAMASTLLVITGTPLDFRGWPDVDEPKIGPLAGAPPAISPRREADVPSLVRLEGDPARLKARTAGRGSGGQQSGSAPARIRSMRVERALPPAPAHSYSFGGGRGLPGSGGAMLSPVPQPNPAAPPRRRTLSRRTPLRTADPEAPAEDPEWEGGDDDEDEYDREDADTLRGDRETEQEAIREDERHSGDADLD